MKPIRPGEHYGVAHLIQRQMLLSSVRQRAVQESPTAESALKRDPDDPGSYDLGFNTDRLSLEQVVDSVKGVMTHQAS
jgi:hypothetical protein